MLLTALASAAIVGGLLLTWFVAPGAKVPCDQAFAESFDQVVAEVGRPATVPAAKESDFSGGHCEDSDGGGVSLTWVTYRTDLPATAVAAYYEQALRDRGWSGVGTRKGLLDRQPLVCGWKATPGHRVEFLVDLPRADSAAHAYTVSVEGDAGRPRCTGSG